MASKKIVIYCRYSSDMQRTDSCNDQEREVRTGLAARGINAGDAVVIRDEAESGTKTNREGFQQLCAMVARGEVAVVAVDTQSRLTRGENAHAFVKDLVYAGGRFIATAENIDTAQTGWEVPVRVKELQNGLEISGLKQMVCRGQRGRVDADGSAGDYPYGYESYYLDQDWAEQLARRGPKPKKGLRVCENEAKWVRQVFDWFVAGRSIGWIARELTRLKVPKGHRTSKPGWHPQQVHRMLTNCKYIGTWVWGKTTTVRDSQGRKKQVAVPAGKEVTRERPDLRIVEQAVWERAATRLAELNAKFGYKDGQKPRGPRPNPADVYPRSPLGGLLVCGKCGANMWQSHSNTRRYYACPSAKKGCCDMTTQVPAEKAENGLTDFCLDLLRAWPDWMQHVFRLTCEAIRVAAARVPEDREQDARRAAELERQIANLVNALAGGMTSTAVTERLQAAEAEKAALDCRLDSYKKLDLAKLELPDEAWVAARLGEWAVRQASGDGPESLLDLALATVVAEPVIAVGKKRGFIRLRFRVNAWGILAGILGDAMPVAIRDFVPKSAPDSGPEFTLDLGAPTAMDRWAPQIAEWRAAGVTWEEIVQRTGMDLNRVFIAWKRYTDSQSTQPDM